MNKNSLIVIILLVVSIIGCTTKIETPKEPTSQFDIYYSFGVGGRNQLDTKNNVYTKDMVCDPPKNFTFQFTESEKKQIYDAILENDLFNIKEDFTKNCNLLGCQDVTPLSGADLNISINGKTKSIRWRANYINPDDSNLKKFMNVKTIIDDIISQKEKEMNIKQPECGYM